MRKAGVVIIGSGQGGVPLATKLARKGREVIIFERAAWGGTCVNTGCFPSKSLLGSAHAAAAARNAQRLGVDCKVAVDFAAVMDRVRDAVQPEGIVQRLDEAGVRMVEEEATLSGPHTVRARQHSFEAKTIVINTGKAPHVPSIDGLKDTPFLTYQTIWQLKRLPEHLLVLGGGYTGLELAQGMQRLGSHVEVIEINERPVSNEETDVSEALEKALTDDGVVFHLDKAGQAVSYSDGQFVLVDELAEQIATGDALLVTTGRLPNVEALNLRQWGIEQDDKGHIRVDHHFRTSAYGAYAIGDVTGQPAFTHISWEDQRRLLDNLDGSDGDRQREDRVLGYAFFTEPQVGHAGLTISEAQDRGYRAQAATLPLKHVARAGATDDENGFYRMVVDTESERILGATLVDPQAAELVHVFMAHMEAGSSWRVLERSQHIHPTCAESLPSLARKFKQ